MSTEKPRINDPWVDLGVGICLQHQYVSLVFEGHEVKLSPKGAEKLAKRLQQFAKNIKDHETFLDLQELKDLP